MSFDLSKQLTRLLFMFIVALSIVFQWYGHRYGLLLTSDSLQYLSAAHSFKTEGIFLSPDGSLYTYWPPLFPVILSLADSPELVLPWINVCVTPGIAFLLFFLADRIFEKNIFRIIFIMISLCNVQMIMISVFLWSELIFFLFVLMAVVCAVKMKHSNLWFVILLIVLCLMCLQRNAGAFLVPAFSLWFLLDRDRSQRERIFKSILMLVVGLGGLVIWNVYLSFFTPSGFYFYKHEFFGELAFNLSRFASTLCGFIIPLSEGPAGVFGCILILIMIFFLFKTERSGLQQLIVLLVLFYFSGFIVLGKLDAYEMDRYLSVIVAFIYMIFLSLNEKMTMKIRPIQQRALVIILMLWLIYPLARTLKNVSAWNERSLSSDSRK